jgi:hypothetical protein
MTKRCHTIEINVLYVVFILYPVFPKALLCLSVFPRSASCLKRERRGGSPVKRVVTPRRVPTASSSSRIISV